jgi:hypothetical protein
LSRLAGRIPAPESPFIPGQARGLLGTGITGEYIPDLLDGMLLMRTIFNKMRTVHLPTPLLTGRREDWNDVALTHLTLL